MSVGTSTSLALPAILDLDAIETVRDDLLEALDAGSVTLSGKAVQRVSTNGLMLMVSAAETARRNGVSFALTSPSPAMAGAIERLGLSGLLADITKD